MKMHHMPVYKLPGGWKLQKPMTNESDLAGDPCMAWFRGFKNKYSAVRAGWPKNLAQQSYEVFERLYGEMFPDGIRQRMRLVGKGTTRIVFISDSNTCFKFQYSDWNNQSEREVAEALAYPDLKCFPKLFDWSDDMQCMAYEVAEEPTQEQFVRTFTQSPKWICEKLEEYAVSGECRHLDMMLSAGILNEQQEKAFRDLMRFQKTTYESQGKCLEDIDHADNWGMLYRDGQPVLVVTDFGV